MLHCVGLTVVSCHLQPQAKKKLNKKKTPCQLGIPTGEFGMASSTPSSASDVTPTWLLTASKVNKVALYNFK